MLSSDFKSAILVEMMRRTGGTMMAREFSRFSLVSSLHNREDVLYHSECGGNRDMPNAARNRQTLLMCLKSRTRRSCKHDLASGGV